MTPPPLVTEATALSLAGSGLVRYAMGTALIGAGADATVVVVEPGDDPGVSGVQDATCVLVRGDRIPELHPRFDFLAAPPLHVFARLDGGCLPLGTARCRGMSSAPASFDRAELCLDEPLTREVLDTVRPVPAPGRAPAPVDWVDQVDTDPVRALESFVLAWFPETEPAGGTATAGHDDLPEPLAAFHRLARLRPALYGFHDPVLEAPRRAAGPRGGRLVFAVRSGAGMDWSIPWPTERADPRVWHTEDPEAADPATTLEAEPLSRFLLQFTLYGAMQAAPFHAATYVMPTARLDRLRPLLRAVPLSPFLPTYEAETFCVAPGLLAAVSGDEKEAVVSFAAHHRGTLTPLLQHDFDWLTFDG
ncbi:hypothetical protein [Streptomyces tritici]|uniref:hypothetical protein n=1 Tax=Streptomyces tritici TaxID=2054410 RepID=UPI003AEFF53A